MSQGGNERYCCTISQLNTQRQAMSQQRPFDHMPRPTWLVALLLISSCATVQSADAPSAAPSQRPSLSTMPSSTPSLSMTPTASKKPSSSPTDNPTQFPTFAPTKTFEPTVDVIHYPPRNCTGTVTLNSGEYILYDEGLCSGDYVFGMNVYGVLGLWKKLALENTPEVADEWGARPWWDPIWIATTDFGLEAIGYGMAVSDTQTEGFLLVYDDDNSLQWFLYCHSVDFEDRLKIRIDGNDPNAIFTLKKKGEESAQELLVINSDGEEFLDDRCFFPYRK